MNILISYFFIISAIRIVSSRGCAGHPAATGPIRLPVSATGLLQDSFASAGHTGTGGVLAYPIQGQEIAGPVPVSVIRKQEKAGNGINVAPLNFISTVGSAQHGWSNRHELTKD